MPTQAEQIDLMLAKNRELYDYFQNHKTFWEADLNAKKALIDAYIVQANNIHPLPFNRLNPLFSQDVTPTNVLGVFDPLSYGTPTNGAVFSSGGFMEYATNQSDPLGAEFQQGANLSGYQVESHILKVTAGAGTSYLVSTPEGDTYRTNNVFDLVNKRMTFAAWVKAGNKNITVPFLVKKNGAKVTTAEEKIITPADGVVHCLMQNEVLSWGAHYVNTITAIPGEEYFLWSPYLANGIVNVLPSNHIDIIRGN